MFRSMQATLYEIFGYLLPGVVSLTAIMILLWAFYMPQSTLALTDLSAQAYIALLVLAYLLGHLTQALGNLLVKKVLVSPEEAALSKGQAASIPYDLVQRARLKAGKMLGIDLEDISPGWLFRICDETLVQRGICSDRDMYIYREGFYRGTMVSMLVLAVALTVRAVIPGTSLRIATSVQAISALVFVFFIILSLAGTWLAFQRYRRFSNYRVTHAVLSFLILQEQNPEPD